MPALNIDMADVKSSNLKRVGYHPDSQTLRVEFNSGAKWDFAEVPAKDHAELMSRDGNGMGSWFHTNIRGAYSGSPMADE